MSGGWQLLWPRMSKRTFAGIAGPQKYSGKDMANSHGSLSVFA